jgi:hypothetical protein
VFAEPLRRTGRGADDRKHRSSVVVRVCCRSNLATAAFTESPLSNGSVRHTIFTGIIRISNSDGLDGRGSFLSAGARFFSSPQRSDRQSVQCSAVQSVTRMEAGSNTSTVALRAVGGDEKGT